MMEIGSEYTCTCGPRAVEVESKACSTCIPVTLGVGTPGFLSLWLEAGIGHGLWSESGS